MNSLGTNIKGRPIHKGPKGGLYVLQDGRKIYKFKKAGSAAPVAVGCLGTNIKGRPIHKGPKGGLYVLQNGKKIYKFKAAVAAPPRVTLRKSPVGGKLTSPLKKRLVNIARALKIRRAAAFNNRVIAFKDKPFKFEKFKFTGEPSNVRNSDTKVTVVKYLNGGTDEGLAVRKDDLPLQKWLDIQSDYIRKLNMYDFHTAMAYTVRSHQWIGPWLRGQKKSVQFTRPVGFVVPLFPQVFALVDKEKNNPQLASWSSWAKNSFNISPQERYKWYSKHIASMPPNLLETAMNVYIKDLQRIIKGAPALPKSMIVYRGLSTDIFKGKVGAVQTLGEFASTAYVPQYLYAPDRYMRIKLLKGTRVLLLQGLNKWDANGEFEVLVNKGAKYIIRKRNVFRPVVNRTFVPAYYNPKKYITDVTIIS